MALVKGIRMEDEKNEDKMEDLIASLADLVSGSADAGTPVVLVKNFLLGFEPTK